MKYQKYSFFEGLYENDGDESRQPQQYLTNLHNVETSLSGRLIRRRGYDSWYDIINGNSRSSSIGLPNVNNKDSFDGRIQAIYSFTDIANNAYIIVVVNKKVYVETFTGGQRIWTCLNPTGDVDLYNIDAHIELVNYLDILFLNDVEKNVYMYNTLYSGVNTWSVVGNKYIYFSGDSIYFRGYSNLDADTHDNDITAVSTGLGGTFTVAGDVTHHFAVGEKFTITGSTNNDGTWTVANIAYAAPNTVITVDPGETVGAAGVDLGTIHSVYRIKIENDTDNVEGKIIYDALADPGFGYISAGGPVDTGSGQTVADLALGMSHRIGDDLGGYRYVVLDCPKNERGNDKCYLLLLNDRLIPQDFVALDMDVTGEVVSYDFFNDGLNYYVYIWCKAGEMHRILVGPSTLSDTTIGAGTDIAGLTGVNNGSTYQYSIAVDDGENIFLYTQTLPSKSDWYQPVQYETIYFEDNNNPNFTDPHPLMGTSIEDPVVTNAGSSIDWAKNGFQGGLNVYNWTQIAYQVYGYTAGGFSGQYYRYYRWYYKQNIDEPALSNSMYPLVIRHEITDSLFNSTSKHPWQSGSAWVSDQKNNFLVSYNVGAFSTKNVGPVAGATDIHNYWGQREALTQDIEDEIRFSYNQKLHYDKARTYPSDLKCYAASGGDLNDVNTNVFYLYNSSYNTDIFTNITTPLYALLVGVTPTGALATRSLTTYDGTKTWRFLYPIGKLTEINNMVPLVRNDKYLYFGSSMDLSGGQDLGRCLRVDITDNRYPVEAKDCFNYDWRMPVSGDTTKWFLRKTIGSDYYYSFGGDWASALWQNDDYFFLSTYNSNLTFHIYKQVSSSSFEEDIDKLQHLGTPKAPYVQIALDGTSVIAANTKLRYYTAFKFFDGTTTMLSSPSEEISITASNQFKVVVSGLDLDDGRGADLYDSEQIESILLYRAKKEGSGLWQEASQIDEITKDSDGNFDYAPYATGTFEDNKQDYSFNPFTEANAKKYPCSHIGVHLQRLILTGMKNSDNKSVTMYSDIDNAQAIDPTNIKEIAAGDKDDLIAGASVGDYYYLFKRNHIYAVFGDYESGELLDVSNSVGCPYKNMIVTYNRAAYFLNKTGVHVVVNGQYNDLTNDKIKNYFDTDRRDSIDFSNITEHGYAAVDTLAREIIFFVPVKVNGELQTENNFAIVYDLRKDQFKTRRYAKNMFSIGQVDDVETDEQRLLFGDYNGRIYDINKNKNDDGLPIAWKFSLNAFIEDSALLNKRIRHVLISGRYMDHCGLTYWIDGMKRSGSVSIKKDFDGHFEARINVRSTGRDRSFIVEMNGEHTNEVPWEIDEIIIAYEPMVGILR